MKAYKCDRCGNFVEGSSFDNNNYYVLRLANIPNSFFDLCPTCDNELKEWFTIVPRRAESEE